MKNRRTFLKTACKPIVLATLGIPILEACSAEEISSSTPPTTSVPSNQTKDPVIINLGNSLFSDLREVGGWINYTAENILLVRISETEVRAFDNRCPHQGNRYRWLYDGNLFTFQYHNNSFSNSCSGSLSCFQTTFEDNIITITFD